MRLLPTLLLLLFCRFVHALPAELHVALWLPAAVADPRPAPGGLAAFNADLAREICRRVNSRCILEPTLFADILPGIEDGRFDLGFGNFLRTPEREQRVAFSVPIWSSSSRLLGRVELDRRLASRSAPGISLGNLHDRPVGAVLGSLQYAYLERIAGERHLRLRGAPTLAATLALLRDGQVDFCLVPMLNAYDMLRGEGAGRFEFVGAPLIDGGLGGTVHVALPKGNEALRQAVNEAIAEMRGDGTYHRLVRRHFPFSLE